MSISEIQKRKFLDNIYRLMYSTGISTTDTVVRQPDEAEVKKEFDDYFVANRIGVPLSLDINLFRNIDVLDPDLMNLFMARALLNVEVLYDSVDDSTMKLMDVVTVLNKRLNNLKDKRVSLEKKIDDILFSISNTDGYFYSFSDSFININNVDISLTTAFVDTENRKVTLPKLKSAAFDFNSPGKIALSNVTYSLFFNGAEIKKGVALPDVNNVFDGLTNTKSTIEHAFDTIGSCGLVIDIPLSTPFVISKIDGRLSTGSALAIVAEIVDSRDSANSQFRRKQSNSDYDRFSFDFAPQNSGLIRLTFIKHEPDYIDQTEPKNKYKYNFTIRDLIVSGQYYDSNAVLVSSPISIPAGDKNKIIDAVSIEAANANPEVGDISFFVAENVENAASLSDFSWIPIASSSVNNPSFDQVISFDRSSRNFINIKSNNLDNEIKLFPLSTDLNISNKNPSTSIYNGVSTYRIGILPEQLEPYSPYILDAVNNFSFKYVSYTSGLYLKKDDWSNIINKKDNNIQVFEPGNIEITSSPSIPVALNLTGISGYLRTSLLVEEEAIINNVISKSGSAVDWDMAVYLNGALIADLQSGLPSKEITWSFIKGVNDIVITFDAEGSVPGSVSLMSGVSITNYGTPFLNYYSYVDPFDFRINRNSQDKVFTIDDYLGNKEILSRSYIQNNSRLYYTSNSINKVESIRFRADLTRFNNPFGTPSLTSYRIKFKNSIWGIYG